MINWIELWNSCLFVIVNQIDDIYLTGVLVIAC